MLHAPIHDPIRVPAVVLTLLLVLTGCAAWTPGWETGPPADPAIVDPPAFAHAEQLLQAADDASSLERARSALQARLAAEPGDVPALLALADAEILRGAAYSDTRRDRRDAFRSGLQYAERALLHNPAFRERIDAGAGIGEAADTLGEDDLTAMLLWVTGVFYYFDEGMFPVQRVIHFDRLREARDVLGRAIELDRTHQHGLPAFSLGIYYIAIPGFAGRDFDRAEALLAEAANADGVSLLPRWGRARYLHTARGDREAFRADLEWVLAREQADSRPHWNTFIRRDARVLLERADDLF